VLVTGAGGSIGSELCRQVREFGPARLVMLDRDESALHAVQLSIEGRALLDDDALVLADIRDVETMTAVFRTHRPEVVFHAAALKHLPLLERYPREAIRTNVVATLDLLDLARDTGCERFVNISTDKAADPISVLGYSKRIAERLTATVGAEAAAACGAVFLSVRFGNVLGSRGSVLDIFQAQIAAGGPLTVTDPDVTRFFMTTTEAVELVIQAGGIGNPGEVLVLDMGEPVRIADVARRFAEVADPRVELEFTGLRPGEKVAEVLFGAGEHDRRPRHPLIAQVAVPALDPDALAGLAARGDPKTALRAVCAHPAPSRTAVHG
jgi:FlaA1/EpsC-like NDP-sugar epimerase